MSRMLWVALTLLASVPATLAAQSTRNVVDACGLYTREEVAALSGAEVTAPKVFNHPNGAEISTSCWYRTRNDSWSVKVIVERSKTAEELKTTVKMLKGVAGQTTGQPVQPVPGLGDEAFWGQVNPTSGMLHVVIGTDFLTVQTYGKAAGAGTLPKTKEIASVVVKRFKERAKGG